MEISASELYKKYRKGIPAKLIAQAKESGFLGMLRSGSREYVRHNVYVERYIDEAWVNAIYRVIPHLSAIIKSPRQFLSLLEETVPVELARKINANTVKHLSSHTQNIRSIDEGGRVTPTKLLVNYSEDTLCIYENRFIMALLNKVNGFVDIRYSNIVARLADEKAYEFGIKGEFSLTGEKANYDLKMKIEADKTDATSGDDFTRLANRVKEIKEHSEGFNNSEFVKTLRDLPPLKPPINKTNLIMKSPDYNACYDLWLFLDDYNKAGYEIKLTDTNPAPCDKMIDESEFIILLYYFLFKKNLSDGDDMINTKFKSQKKILPKIARKYDTAFDESFDPGTLDDRAMIKEDKKMPNEWERFTGNADPAVSERLETGDIFDRENIRRRATDMRSRMENQSSASRVPARDPASANAVVEGIIQLLERAGYTVGLDRRALKQRNNL